MTTVRKWSTGVWVIVGILATVLLAGLSLVTVGLLGGGFTAGGPGSRSGDCAAPNLSGTVVNVTTTDRGGPMMGGDHGPWSGASMRLRADRATVEHGTVSFLVTNRGNITHEMVVLSLPDSHIVGTRAIAGDQQIDEAGNLGEASNTCGDGGGEGILPGTSGWMTVTLKPGQYELVCNLPGHYAAGMYTQLTVT